jgi:hypothetical protein
MLHPCEAPQPQRLPAIPLDSSFPSESRRPAAWLVGDKFPKTKTRFYKLTGEREFTPYDPPAYRQAGIDNNSIAEAPPRYKPQGLQASHGTCSGHG